MEESAASPAGHAKAGQLQLSQCGDREQGQAAKHVATQRSPVPLDCQKECKKHGQHDEKPNVGEPEEVMMAGITAAITGNLSRDTQTNQNDNECWIEMSGREEVSGGIR